MGLLSPLLLLGAPVINYDNLQSQHQRLLLVSSFTEFDIRVVVEILRSLLLLSFLGL